MVAAADSDQRVLCDPVTVNRSGLPAALITENVIVPDSTNQTINDGTSMYRIV